MNKNSKRRWWGWHHDQKKEGGFARPVYKAKKQPFPSRGANPTNGPK